MVAHNRVLVVGPDFDDADEWVQRQLVIERNDRMDGVDLFLDPPAAVVLDLDTSDDRQRAICWRLHDALNVPLLLISSDQSPKALISLLRRGADEVVDAPASSRVTAATVAAVLRRRHVKAGGLPDHVELDGATLDLARGVIQRANGVHTLSPTEHRLLLALLRAHGHARTHRELVTQVWGIERASARHYLRLYIRYLREKLEDDPRHPRVILSVWGVGYRLAWTCDAARADPGQHSSPAHPSASREDEPPWNAHSSSSGRRHQLASQLQRYAG